MFEIVPSIWIIKGKVIRLVKGDFTTEEVITHNPLEIAQQFEDHGIKRLHLVDLDGARKGSPVNYHVLETIAGYTNLKIDFTGGLSTDGDINKAFEYGAKSITVASQAAKNPDLFVSWIMSYGREKINLGADTNSKDYKIKIRGWEKATNLDIFDHIGYFYERGLKYVKSSDISRDGVMEGPNFEMYDAILKKFPDIKLVASGGVRNVDDMKRLYDMGLHGVIFGRAFYEGKISLKDLDQLILQTNS